MKNVLAKVYGKVKRPIDMDSETKDSFRRKENQRLEQPILHNI